MVVETHWDSMWTDDSDRHGDSMALFLMDSRQEEGRRKKEERKKEETGNRGGKEKDPAVWQLKPDQVTGSYIQHGFSSSTSTSTTSPPTYST